MDKNKMTDQQHKTMTALYRSRAIWSFLILSTALGVGIAVLFYISGATISLIGVLSFLIIVLISWILFTFKNETNAAAVVIVGMLTVTFWVTIFTGGFHSPVLIWLAFSPLVAGFLLGKRWSVSLAILAILFMFSLHFISLNFVAVAEFKVMHEEGMSHGFSIASVTLAIIAFLFFSIQNSDALANIIYESDKREKTDSLTGILNRRGFNQVIKGMEDGNARSGGALLLFDVDKFKLINDTHGHPFGDTVLQIVAHEAKAVLRGDDQIARIGGDEFAVVLTNVDHTQAINVGSRIRERINRAAKELNELQDIGVGVSVGIAICDSAVICSSEAMLQLADAALYQAKKSTDGVVLLQMA